MLSGLEQTTGTCEPIRCRWAEADELLKRYHDEEWGRPPQSDAEWLERVILETFQAGLSWRTVLHKRQNFREAFFGFDLQAVAGMDENDVERLMNDAGLIRNRKKIEAALENGRIALRLVQEHGGLSVLLDPLRGEREPLIRFFRQTFRFVGPTTAESIAYATGWLPTPHEASCFLFTP